ncbi:MAG: glycosyltransferase family 4 protein [Rhodomicrobium sp.]
MPKPIPRVMMALPRYPFPIMGGLERQAHELAKALRLAGAGVQAISGTFDSSQPRQEMVEGVLVHRIPWPASKAIRLLRTPFDVFYVLYSTRKSYDVIHLHQHSLFGLFTILCAKLLGKPILVKLPNVGKYGIPGMLEEFLGRLRLAILLKSDAVVAMSEVSRAELGSVRFPPGRILSTPNGIQLDGLPPSRDARAGMNPCRVVFAGRLSEEKMLDTLLRAWREVQEASALPAVLEVWGDGPEDARLKLLCSDLGIERSVFFRGHVEQVREKFASMDIFVLPSSNEGNSNAILEAMAAGLPIVSTRVGGTPMQVGPEGACMLGEPGDKDALKQNLRTLIQDVQLRVTLGAAMRHRAEVYFDIGKIAATYAEAYRLLLAGERDEIYKTSNPIIAPLNNAVTTLAPCGSPQQYPLSTQIY